MDHSAMDHSAMDHSKGHAGMNHPGMGDTDSCSMNMLFTWNYKNTCVVFHWWHIKTVQGLLLSCVALFLLSGLYEYLKYYLNNSQRLYEVTSTSSNNETNVPANVASRATKRIALSRSMWYGFQVGYSFMLMLVFMTYNGWLMIAVVLGAAWGHYHWGSKCAPSSQSLACH
ncbi:Copper transport protein CTR2 [Nakaseomyces bracarensis]|uniref:Copper transport protein n=1 Tax=Nakaseomyces bracarensis TaxID=273131 RepID=A0ABR4NM20_9SACH